MLGRAPLAALAIACASGCAPVTQQADQAALRELAPTGKIRFGVVSAPEPSTLFVLTDASGRPRGATVDLATELGKRLGAPVEFTVAPNTGQLTDALAAGRLDAAFMPVDAERLKRLDFGPAYALSLNTYLVRPGSNIRVMADVDRPDVRVVAVAGTTTIRSAQRVLKTAKVSPATSVDDALEALRTNNADAFALTHDTLVSLAPRVPGSRILEGSFNEVRIAIAVPKERPAALAYVTRFIEDAKASGTVRQAFDRSGLKSSAVAPPAATR